MTHSDTLRRMAAMLDRGEDKDEVFALLLLLAKAMVREERQAKK